MSRKLIAGRKLLSVASHRAAWNMRVARLASGKSMKEVAEACGVTTGAISRWEVGDRWPEPEHLRKFVECVGLDTGDLFKGEDKKRPQRPSKGDRRPPGGDLGPPSGVPQGSA